MLAAAGNAIKARQAKQALAEEAAAALRVPTVFELAERDVVTVRNRSLVQVVDISGTVRAVNTAVVKAKVAGEVQGLQVREGDRVSAGQVLGHVDTTEFQARVDQADEQAQAAAAQVAIVQRALSNNQALVNQGFISATALDTSASNLAAAQASHRAAVAALAIAPKSLMDTALRSPLTGQVASRTLQNAERVAVDGRVLEVVDLTAMELEVAVTPSDAGGYFDRHPFFVGLWYRGIPLFKRYAPGYGNNDAIAALVGVIVHDMRIGYSYDITISRLAGQSAGAHEITLGFDLVQRGKKRSMSRRRVVPCAKF